MIVQMRDWLHFLNYKRTAGNLHYLETETAIHCYTFYMGIAYYFNYDKTQAHPDRIEELRATVLWNAFPIMGVYEEPPLKQEANVYAPLPITPYEPSKPSEFSIANEQEQPIIERGAKHGST